MSLYGALSKHNHLSEFGQPLDVGGNIVAPATRRQTALRNLTGISDLTVADIEKLLLLEQGALATGAGTGITTGTGVVYASSVQKVGEIFLTRILIDLTGLTSADSDLDVIGVEDTALPCHIGQITAALNGTIFAGSVKCLEAPASLTDIGIYSDPDGTLVYEDAIATAGDGETIILTPAVQAVANGAVPIANVVPADDYLYIVNGAADTPDIFTAGKLLIELYGI